MSGGKRILPETSLQITGKQMTAPQILLDLIERFKLHVKSYKAVSYNEMQLRIEFIDPLCKALGWDIDNERGYAEAYKDVVHEDAIKIGGSTKAPDYAFRVGGVRKFFLEAKRPAINIKDDISPAYQLRRYAWSAKLPLSILTDFEEFAVYDCRVKPEKADQARTARVAYYTYENYAEKWDEIAAVFSRESILKGSFDKYADDNKHKRGTAEVDDVFLQEIESWRESLARNIALRNPGLPVRELNTAVQRTIDRIIFLRIAEDRGIEAYGQLQGLRDGKNVYTRLAQILRKADDRYNSGLFHFKKGDGSAETLDTFTLGLVIEDKILKNIIKSLYYPDSPYEFSVLPADILGQVYEQFLGKVIRLSGNKAIVEEKPEVKKAGGVYYTPTYIVRYIVETR
jgi:predicted type IV restriction endonuclease